MTVNVKKPGFWRRLADRLVFLSQYLTGEEVSAEDANDAAFRAAFPDLEGGEKRSLSRHRICIPAVLIYGMAGSSEKTEVTNLNSRGLFVFCSTALPHAASIQVEMVLPSELNLYGRRHVRYHATVVRVEPQPSGERFGIAAAIKKCDDLPLETADAMFAK